MLLWSGLVVSAHLTERPCLQVSYRPAVKALTWSASYRPRFPVLTLVSPHFVRTHWGQTVRVATAPQDREYVRYSMPTVGLWVWLPDRRKGGP